MRLLKLITMLSVLTLSLMVAGCNPLDYFVPDAPEVKFEKNDTAELAEKVKVKVWVKNKATGKKEIHPATLHPHYIVGREGCTDPAHKGK